MKKTLSKNPDESTNEVETTTSDTSEKKTKKITPEIAGGFRDYLPEDMLPRQKIFQTIQSVFEKYGFLPLETPGLEKQNILTGGDPNFKMMMFKAGIKGENEDLALRFDLTVPLARVVSMYGDKIEKPFKRYQNGKVWRGEKPQAGRFREFTQFDADIVGTNRRSADAEIIALIYDTMNALNLTKFKIRLNNRKILNGLPDYASYNSKLNTEVLKSIDKLDKISFTEISKELKDKGLNDQSIKKIKDFIELQPDANLNSNPKSNSNNSSTFSELKELMKDSEEGLIGISELEEVCNNLEALGVSKDFWQIDLSVARGLGYYTGIIFETILLDLPSIGSVFSGGRYDNLVARFGGAPIPAVGASVGVDRLFAALEKLSLVKIEKTNVKFLVLNFDKNAEIYCQKITAKLRNAGIATELYLGREELLKTQLAYALKQEIPFVIIVGEDEMKENVLQIKDLKNRNQEKVSFDELVARAQSLIK